MTSSKVWASTVLEDADAQGRIKNMRSAKHRHESEQKPLGRQTLCRDALTSTLVFAWQKRKDTAVGKIAHEHLERFSEERCLLKAMMADAADEVIILKCYTDSNDMDVVSAPEEVNEFRKRVIWLFGAEHGCLTTGYTHEMMNKLKQPKIFRTKNGLKTIGSATGANESVVKACLDRMGAWLTLALEVLDTEFPQWSLLKSLNCLSLSSIRRQRDTEGLLDMEVEDSFEHLAAHLGVDVDNLKRQAEHYRDRARSIYISTGCITHEAWAKALVV